MVMQEATPSPSLVALKPRQVALLSSNPTMKSKQDTSWGLGSAQRLNPHQQSLLFLSIAHFLQRNSFSKTLKKFLSEAQLQKDDLTGSSLDLEEMCCKYLAMSDLSGSNINREQVQGWQVDGNSNSDKQVGIASAVETDTQKKKKRGNKSSTDAIACIAGQSGDSEKYANSKPARHVLHEESKAPAVDIMGDSLLDKSAKKEKEKKKKSKLDSESHADNLESYPSKSLGGESEKKSKDAVSTENNIVSDAAIENNSKNKKKNKSKLTSDSFVDSVDQRGSESKPHAGTTLNSIDISLEDKISKSKKKKKKDDSEDIEKGKSSIEGSKDNKNKTSEDATITDSKGSKKRKRLDSEVHDSQPVEDNAIEDSKRRKTESSEEQNTKLNSLGGANKHVSKETNGECGEFGVNEFEKKPSKQLHEKENGNIEKNGKNSGKKNLEEQNGSVQPKNPFQRVNADEVVFVDKRLEDNSYWAKDGAENGYGAKAQEILGQVRGRDFRHEKTKKKRGSYRGGQIDMQSHSIKFSYSDDE